MNTKFNGINFAVAVFSVMLLMSIVSASPDQEDLNDNQTAKDRFEAAKNAFEKAQENYKAAKTAFEKARDDFKANKTDINTTINATKDAMNKHIDNHISWLNMTRVRIEGISTKYINESDRTLLLNEVDSYIASISAFKTNVSAITNRSDIKNVSDAIKAEWEKERSLVKKIVGIILVGKANFALGKADELYANLTQKTAESNAKGINTTTVDTALVNLKTAIDTARMNVSQARTVFLSITTVQDAEKNFQDGHALIKAANKQVRDAFKSVKEVIADLRKEVKEQVRANKTAEREERKENKTGNNTNTTTSNTSTSNTSNSS